MPTSILQCLESAQEPGLAGCIRKALASLPPGTLPLHAACSRGGMIDESDLSLTVLGSQRTAEGLSARVGVFFTERVGGCSCHDGPIEATAYGVIEVREAAASGEFTLRYIGEA